MGGLILIAIAAVWFVAVCFFVRWVSRHFKLWELKVLTWLVLVPALMVAPLLDEIVGKRQFERLCKENSTIQIDRAAVAGKTVYLDDAPYVEIKGKWMRFGMRQWRYLEVGSGETLVSFNLLYAGRGRLIKALGIQENGPLTFQGSCQPSEFANLHKLFQTLHLTQIERSTLEVKDQK
jgi:hypothetical protein